MRRENVGTCGMRLVTEGFGHERRRDTFLQVRIRGVLRELTGESDSAVYGSGASDEPTVDFVDPEETEWIDERSETTRYDALDDLFPFLPVEEAVYRALSGCAIGDWDGYEDVVDSVESVSLTEPPVRKRGKNGLCRRGGRGPGNHVDLRVQQTAPAAMQDRRRLEREFWREVSDGGQVPYDAHCESCRRRLPHTKEGLRVLISLLLREGADEEKINDIKRVLAAA